MNFSCKNLFWTLVIALGLWGALGAVSLVLQGKEACTLCLWHRTLYGGILVTGILGFLTQKRFLMWLSLGILAGEVFVALGQVTLFLCPKLCRVVSLAEKANLFVAAIGLVSLLFLHIRAMWGAGDTKSGGRTKAKMFLFLLGGALLFPQISHGGMGCSGRFVNPVTDVCWKCLFPINICGFELFGSCMPDTPSPSNFPICFCKRPLIPVPVPGIPVGFWEPARLIDVTKSPMCMVSLGGISLGSGPSGGTRDDKQGTAFYHVHWYIYPVLYWLELLMDFVCLEMASVDVAYMTEFDPLWIDDVKSSILNPEAILFGNPIAQGACIADGVGATAGLSNDALFWCSGCQGSLYPYTGNISGTNGGVQASTLLLGRMIAKLHRSLLAWGYYGSEGLCGKYPMPIIKKSQYRYQMTYPIPEIVDCKRIGQPEFLWGSGREFPIKGEDFGYLLWRKRDCCLL